MQDKTNILGIDFSHHNDVTAWSKVKADFAYLKATEGTSFTDPKFYEYAKAAKSHGLLIGAYHFARLGDPVAEAKHFLQVITQESLDLLPVLDLEEQGRDIEQWVRAFQKALKRPFILYTGNWYIDTYFIHGLEDLPLWTSYYRDKPPYDCGGWNRWTMWQYSDKGQIPGIEGYVDLNVASSIGDILDYQPCDLVRTVIAVGLNVRSEPWVKDSNVNCVLTKGQQIHLSKLRGDWAYTTYGSQGGWVSRHYLT